MYKLKIWKCHIWMTGKAWNKEDFSIIFEPSTCIQVNKVRDVYHKFVFADEIVYLRNNLHGDIMRFNMDSTQSHLIQLHALNKEQPPPQQYNTAEKPRPQHHTTHRRGRNHNWAIITLLHLSVRILVVCDILKLWLHHQSDNWRQTSTRRVPNSHFYFW